MGGVKVTDDEALMERFGKWVRAQHPAPTVAVAAKALGLSPLHIAELAGAHYWIFLTGDLSSPETAIVDHDGE
jgi:hypothetical protein